VHSPGSMAAAAADVHAATAPGAHAIPAMILL
jgi:hypothetical protein